MSCNQPNRRDLLYYLGDSFEGISVQWLDAASAPKVVTGYAVHLTIEDSNDVQLVQLSLGTGLVLDEPTAKVDISATPAMMAGIAAPGTYRYDLQFTSPDTTIKKTILYGRFSVNGQVTLV